MSGVGFLDQDQTGPTARYLRTAGGALMRLDRAGDGLLAWVCGGCRTEAWYGYPLTTLAGSRHATEAAAAAAAEDQALAHAHACTVAAQMTPQVDVRVDPRVRTQYLPVLELAALLGEDLAALVGEYTGTEMPSVRIVVTTWWGWQRRRFAEVMAVAGRGGLPLRALPGFVLAALHERDVLATALPDRHGGVTILIDARRMAHSGLPMRRLLLHELRHAAQLARPWYRARWVAQARHDAWVERDPASLGLIDALLEQAEREAEDAEEWSWEALQAERAVTAEQQEAADSERAGTGRTRVTCRCCGFKYYIDAAEPGPHTCHLCRSDGH